MTDICQYCGSELQTNGCINPACPGRLRPTGESSNGATSGQDSTLLGPAPVEVERLVDDLLSVSKQLGQSEARGLYDHIEPAEVAINDLKSRLLVALSNKGENLSGDVIVPVEKLEQDLEQYITLGSTGCRTIAEDVEFNRLHSKFLAALTNTTPYLSGDVNVPVAQDDCIERIISYVDEYINDQIDRVVLKSEIGLVLDDIFYSYLQKGG